MVIAPGFPGIHRQIVLGMLFACGASWLGSDRRDPLQGLDERKLAPVWPDKHPCGTASGSLRTRPGYDESGFDRILNLSGNDTLGKPGALRRHRVRPCRVASSRRFRTGIRFACGQRPTFWNRLRFGQMVLMVKVRFPVCRPCPRRPSPLPDAHKIRTQRFRKQWT